MMKKVIVLGGGISGCYAAIRIKESHKDYDVSIFEHNDKLLKKIYATGNGKCNFANKGELVDKYNNDSFALPILKEYTYQDIVKYFESMGIKTKAVGDLLYPYSESAETVAIKLLKRIEDLGIKSYLSIRVDDYSNGQFKTDRGIFNYDALIIAIGGVSSPSLGSNGDFWPVLKKHGYLFSDVHPSLCPIKVKENTKMVDGQRHKATVSLYQGNKLIHQEDGELLFKKDGLSGMVILNTAHYINRLDNKNNVTVHIDFAKGESGDIESLVNPKIAKYLISNKLDLHNTVFTFKDFYPYDNSHVTSGGISLSQINNDLSSKLEKNVFFIGEILDIDGVCGGYNIMWAFASAERVNKAL